MTRRPCYLVSTTDTWKRRRGDKLTIGTVSHVAQSLDSDSNAFFLVIETTVHGRPNGWGGKSPDFISSLKHWSPNKHVNL